MTAMSADEEGTVNPQFAIRWFAWREVHPAIAYARGGGMALHRFHYDLRRFGLGRSDPVCHVIATDPQVLMEFGLILGMPRIKLSAPRPHRPDIWHFDAFDWVLANLEAAYPPPEGI
jgi:hypothetical protein